MLARATVIATTSAHCAAVPVMQAERQELGLWVVPGVLMPCDVLRRQEVLLSQQWVPSPELYEAAAEHIFDSSPSPQLVA